jgi:hypothetical protein
MVFALAGRKYTKAASHPHAKVVVGDAGVSKFPDTSHFYV